MTYFGPNLDPSLGEFRPNGHTDVRGHEYFIPIKLGKYQSSDPVVEVDYVFPYIYMQ